MDFKPTQRFSDRVDNYVKFRPSYPSELLKFFTDQLGLTAASVVVDVGSGTGISTEIFLKNGNIVYGVEPNAKMRAAAEKNLVGYPDFHSVNGSSENTGLPANSVDFVIAAQAFHWFEPVATQKEFKRILKSPGTAALIWNDRRMTGTGFNVDYEALIAKYGSDYKQVRHNNIDHSQIESFLGAYNEHVIFNYQDLDFDGLLGRLLSSSYMPQADSEVYPAMKVELQALFDKYQKNGMVRIEYDTRIFHARMK
ncbi:class I SAM-dependent methyltransferase [Bdellovibrio bacteriovorus]|uniref:SAM-dependent methyltransferase n=1 Tax=Bdellovibrio bacteriovorus TaxID=959 RepID=A0A1Z3N5D6_BDEBC|nr:class I SAM-dependent methyltransferase [Bdellovibrio bacteriovorus]ASD62686.1 SAM-dependent methyltransferase [Bdellovibrio bacteriovorus]